MQTTYIFAGQYDEKEILKYAMMAEVKPGDKVFLLNYDEVKPEALKEIIDIVLIKINHNIVEDATIITNKLKELKAEKIKLGLGADTYLAFTALLSALLYKNVTPGATVFVYVNNNAIGLPEWVGPRELRVLCFLKDKAPLLREDVVKALMQEYKIKAITIYKTFMRMENKALISVDVKKGTINLTTLGKLIAAISC